LLAGREPTACRQGLPCDDLRVAVAGGGEAAIGADEAVLVGHRPDQRHVTTDHGDLSAGDAAHNDIDHRAFHEFTAR